MTSDWLDIAYHDRAKYFSTLGHCERSCRINQLSIISVIYANKSQKGTKCFKKWHKYNFIETLLIRSKNYYLKVSDHFLKVFFRTPPDLFLNFDVESSRFTTLQFSTSVEVRLGIVILLVGLFSTAVEVRVGIVS